MVIKKENLEGSAYLEYYSHITRENNMTHFVGTFFEAIKDGWNMFWSLPKDVARGIGMVFHRIHK